MGDTRYAIYFSPEPESKLWLFGSRWLGRDSVNGDDLKRLKVKDLSEKRLAEITKQAAHYGFHATLKPPFRLSKGHDLEMLDEALEAFAAAREPFTIPGLELAELDGFIALRPAKKCKALDKLAADCVKEFDHFRKAPGKKELEKRLKADLTDKQKKMLEKWGYPYVLDEYRFHMTLTERLKGKERKAVMAELEPHAKKVIGKKVKVLDITLFKQNKPDEPFEMVKCYAFNRLPKTRWPQQKKK